MRSSWIEMRGPTGPIERDDVSDEDESRINEDVNNEARPVQGSQMSQSSMIHWDRFLPLRSLKILLVENDYSTRHVLGALLRNCSYEVKAVENGLEAWKILEDPTNHIDLVLTELDMPSISGIDLLTRIMNHKTRNNIPVIMMSSDDSMGIVFKCLSNGAADFLVKPIRKNELKNLWQHVWRKCHSSSGSGSESGVRAKKSTNPKGIEGSDNLTDSNEEDENGSFGLNNGDGSDNGSGTQLQSSWSKQKTPIQLDLQLQGPTGPAHELEKGKVDLNKTDDTGPTSKALRKMGIYDTNNKKDDPLLELSLKQIRDVSDTGNSAKEYINMLNHSNLSAFSRYNNSNSSKVGSSLISGNPGTCTAINNNLETPKTGSSTNNIDMGSTTIKPEEALPKKVVDPTENTNEKIQVEHHHHHYHHYHHHVHDSSSKKNKEKENVEGNAANYGSGSSGTHQGSNGRSVAEVANMMSSDNGGSAMDEDRSARREAALNKFRLKRKDRCFDKKVRYQSRKRLAEQRPRVRGQFVRQPVDEIKGRD